MKIGEIVECVPKSDVVVGIWEGRRREGDDAHESFVWGVTNADFR
jgi:hypothetical protein